MALTSLITLVAILGVGYYIWQYTDIPQQIQSMMKGSGGNRPGGSAAPAPAAKGGGDAGAGADVGGDLGGNLSAGTGQTMFPSTGKKWTAKDSGKTTRNYASGGSSGTTQWDIKGVGPITNLEVTTVVNVGGCGDEVSIKVYGPSHSGSNCCWFIMDVNCNSGQFMMGGEGPHPKTSKNGLGTGGSIGSMKNKDIGIKLVIYKAGSSYTAIGYSSVGGTGGWKEQMRKSFTQFGESKKSSTPHADATIQFRTDCNGVKYKEAWASEIHPPGSAAFAKAMMARAYYRGGSRKYSGRFIYPEHQKISLGYNARQYKRLPAII